MNKQDQINWVKGNTVHRNNSPKDEIINLKEIFIKNLIDEKWKVKV